MSNPTWDAPNIRFHDGVHRVECTKGCTGDVPAELVHATTAGVEWVRRLWERGTATSGDVRVLVVQLGDPQTLLGPASPWPGDDLAEIALMPSEADFLDFGAGRLVTGGVATALRALRAEYRAGAHGNWFYRYLPIEDPTGESPGYRAYVRDVLPFEDANGLVPMPPLP